MFFVHSHYPSEVKLRLSLAATEQPTRLTWEFRHANEVVHQTMLAYPDGAPEHVSHTLKLAPGTYDAILTIARNNRALKTLTQRFTVPTPHAITFQLKE